MNDIVATSTPNYLTTNSLSLRKGNVHVNKET